MDVYETQQNLEMNVAYDLDVNVHAIARGDNLEDAVFKLVKWAQREGRLEEVISRTRARFRGNADFQAITGPLIEALRKPLPLLPGPAVPVIRLMSLGSVILCLVLAVLLAAISVTLVWRWLILAVVAGVGLAVAWKARASVTVEQRICRILDNRRFAACFLVASVLFLVGDAYAIVRSFRVSPVVVLVPTDHFMNRLGDPVRLELTFEARYGQGHEFRKVDSYQGEPLLIGSRQGIEVPPEVRQNYISFAGVDEPRVLPGSPIRLSPGMRILIRLYYANSDKLYLDPPQAPIVVKVPRRSKDWMQVEELDGP
jgi:hypothetical protein